MKECKVIKKVTLTAEEGSQVIISEEQYKLVEAFVEIEGEKATDTNPNKTQKKLSAMNKKELLEVAKSLQLEIAEDTPNKKIKELIENAQELLEKENE